MGPGMMGSGMIGPSMGMYGAWYDAWSWNDDGTLDILVPSATNQ